MLIFCIKREFMWWYHADIEICLLISFVYFWMIETWVWGKKLDSLWQLLNYIHWARVCCDESLFTRYKMLSSLVHTEHQKEVFYYNICILIVTQPTATSQSFDKQWNQINKRSYLLCWCPEQWCCIEKVS